MNTFRLKFIMAICVALMDVIVAAWCGPLLWHVWGNIPAARVGLLFLAGGCSFTLANIWSLTIHLWPQPPVSDGEDTMEYSDTGTPIGASDV